MKIGIISDSHDSISNLKKAVKKLKEENVGLIIHCGDLCAPFMLFEFKDFPSEVHLIFGNVDGDRYLMTKMSQKDVPNVKIHGELGEIEIEGKKIAFTHYPFFAEGLAATGKYDIVFYGHTHITEIKNKGNSILANPGEILGRKDSPSFAVYDTETGKCEIKKLI